MSEFTAYLNGQWIGLDDVKLDVADRGFMGGDVVFEITRTFGGKSFRLDEHLDRLYRSLKYVRIDPGMDQDEMRALTEDALGRNLGALEEGGDLSIQHFVTRGKGRKASLAGPPTVCIRVYPLDFERYASLFESGVHGVITRTRSFSSDSLDPKVKHYSRMNFALADLEASDVDPEGWPILLDQEGNLAEGISYNVFLVSDGVIKTPGDHSILQGVSRQTVFDLADGLRIPVAEEQLQPYDLYNADEAFFTATSYCVLPVTKVDWRPVGDGVVGPVTRQLLAAWSEHAGVDIIDQALRFS